MADFDPISGEGVDAFVASQNQAVAETASSLPWMKKYQPKVVSDMILPDSIRSVIDNAIKMNSIGNYIFYSSSSGTGKTSLAEAIPNTLGTEGIFLCPKRSSEIIETIRKCSYTKIMNGKPRIIILDECDYPMNPQKFFRELQSTIDDTADTLRYIITCNDIWRIPDHIVSRCQRVDFTYPADDRELKNGMYQRLCKIADAEAPGKYDKATLADMVSTFYPDMRLMIESMHTLWLRNGGSITGKPPVPQDGGFVGDAVTAVLGGNVDGIYKVGAMVADSSDHFVVEFGRAMMTAAPAVSRARISISVAKYADMFSNGVCPEIIVDALLCECMLIINKDRSKV